VRTTITRLIGKTEMDVATSAMVKWKNDRLRVALVLDNTGSMSSAGKITALKTATANLLTTLRNAATTNGDVYVSITPFAVHVNADPANYTQTWIDWTQWEAPPAGSMPSGSVGPVLVNNTIVGGSGATQGAAVWAGGFDSKVSFYNNLLIGLTGQNAVYCDSTYSSVPPVFADNDAYSASGTGLEGTCATEAGENGNISLDPLFVNMNRNNYTLQSTSPAINVGDNSAPDIPAKDLASKPRIVDGTIDMGAYEFQ